MNSKISRPALGIFITTLMVASSAWTMPPDEYGPIVPIGSRLTALTDIEGGALKFFINGSIQDEYDSSAPNTPVVGLDLAENSDGIRNGTVLRVTEIRIMRNPVWTYHAGQEARSGSYYFFIEIAFTDLDGMPILPMMKVALTSPGCFNRAPTIEEFRQAIDGIFRLEFSDADESRQAINSISRRELLSAAREGNLAEVERLATAIDNVNIRNNDSEGATALMWAAHNGHIDIIDALLARCADINAQDNEGDTALIEAARRGDTRMVEALISRHAYVDLRNHADETALSYAAGRGHEEIARILRLAGARPRKRRT